MHRVVLQMTREPSYLKEYRDTARFSNHGSDVLEGLLLSEIPQNRCEERRGEVIGREKKERSRKRREFRGFDNGLRAQDGYVV